MKIVETKTSTRKSKPKKTSVNYSNWDPLTQAKYLYDLHQQLGSKINRAEAYELALKAVGAD
ncbi:MAG: hypothetical protein COT73_05555 [Bdellovibrio sp. CG10_big_fil_rev_8_21_14_0_10_47_8]|nr:MAG: hypothetical protein COT73_05555 [Bdellovibrio sp. CG10_big_fil_rev_8_21_14_0_10_47_8]